MLCTDASPVHPVLKDFLLGADVFTPIVCTDAPSVEPVLKKLLFLDADVITPVVCTDAPSVEPVLKKLLLALDIVSGTKDGQCTDALSWTVGSTGASRLTWLRFLPSGLATPIFSLFVIT